MKKCKNEKCDKILDNVNRTYCSLSCRNVYVNTYLKDYTINDKIFNDKREKRIETYYKNPKHCPYCDNIIVFELKHNKYCSASCGAIMSNLSKEYTWSDKISAGVSKYYEDIREKKYCKTCFKQIKGSKKYCNKTCKNNFYWKDLPEYQRYKKETKFIFSLKTYSADLDIKLLELYGFYSPKNGKINLNGVSRDHMYSVNDGFKNNINPLILAHPANCKLLRHNDNISKNKKSSITLEELLHRIKYFDDKYGKYYPEKIDIFIKIKKLNSQM